MRVAIVGCGSIARAHADVVLEREDATLVGAVDTDRDARDRAGSEWGCPAYESVASLLTDQAVDLACVCTPPSSHRELATQLLECDVHVLCEKPIATTAVDARAMFGLACERGLMLAVSAKFCFVDDLIEAGELLRDGRIGRPINYAVSFCSPVPMGDRWNAQPAVSGGGVVMDNAPHALDVLSHVTDSHIRRLTAGFAGPGHASEVEHSAEILFEAESGAMGRIALSWTYSGKDLDYLVVQGTAGTIRVGWTGGAWRKHGEREWTSFGAGYDKRKAFSGQLAAIHEWVCVEAVGQKNEKKRLGSSGITALDFVEAVYRSRESGSWESLDDGVRVS